MWGPKSHPVGTGKGHILEDGKVDNIIIKIFVLRNIFVPAMETRVQNYNVPLMLRSALVKVIKFNWIVYS